MNTHRRDRGFASAHNLRPFLVSIPLLILRITTNSQNLGSETEPTG
jgi:hypothetical protein